MFGLKQQWCFSRSPIDNKNENTNLGTGLLVSVLLLAALSYTVYGINRHRGWMEGCFVLKTSFLV